VGALRGISIVFQGISDSFEKLTWLHLESERQCSTFDQHKEKPMKSKSKSTDQLFNRIANERLYIETWRPSTETGWTFTRWRCGASNARWAAAYAEGLAEGSKSITEPNMQLTNTQRTLLEAAAESIERN
jgi:hypothetical protein